MILKRSKSLLIDRINALENLDKIATILGTERTRTELIPYVSGTIFNFRVD